MSYEWEVGCPGDGSSVTGDSKTVDAAKLAAMEAAYAKHGFAPRYRVRLSVSESDTGKVVASRQWADLYGHSYEQWA